MLFILFLLFCLGDGLSARKDPTPNSSTLRKEHRFASKPTDFTMGEIPEEVVNNAKRKYTTKVDNITLSPPSFDIRALSKRLEGSATYAFLNSWPNTVITYIRTTPNTTDYVDDVEWAMHISFVHYPNGGNKGFASYGYRRQNGYLYLFARYEGPNVNVVWKDPNVNPQEIYLSNDGTHVDSWRSGMTSMEELFFHTLGTTEKYMFEGLFGIILDRGAGMIPSAFYLGSEYIGTDCNYIQANTVKYSNNLAYLYPSQPLPFWFNGFYSLPTICGVGGVQQIFGDIYLMLGPQPQLPPSS